MKISIITPVYNSATTIEKTILSVIAQKRTSSIEYIIIDGGSKDETIQVVNKYIEHIDVFISEPDCGPYDAMNKGIIRASGEIIGIINSDDWYLDGAIAKVEQEFCKDENIFIVYAPIKNYYKGEYVATFFPGDLNKLLFRFTLNHPSCFIKKEAYNLVGLYNLEYAIAADYDLILRLFSSGLKFHCVSIPLASYSLSGMSSSAIPLDRIRLIHECWKISCSNSNRFSTKIALQRWKVYIAWILNELFALPARYFLKPPLARKLKTLLTSYLGKLVSDSYGKW